MKLRELVITFGFDIDDKPLKDLEGKLNGLKILTGIVAVGFAALSAAAYTMFHLAEGAAESRIELEKTAQMVGVTVTALRGLQFAAKLSHLETGTVTMALRLLSRNALQAAQGSAQAAGKFASMGIELRGADGKMRSADQMLLSISDRFKNMPDGVAKTAMAMQLFGRSGAQMIPMLNKGREELAAMAEEGKKFFVTVPNYLEKSEAFGRAHVRINEAMENLKNTIGAEVMPPLTELMNTLTEWYMKNKDIIAQNLSGMLEALIPLIRTATTIFTDLVDIGNGVVNFLGGGANAMRLLVAGFTGLFALGIVSNIGKIIEVIMILRNMVMSLAMAEGLATGGMNLLIGAGVAAGTYGIMSAMDSKMGLDKFTPGSTGDSNSKVTHNHWEIKPTYNVDARGAQHGAAEEFGVVIKKNANDWLGTGASAGPSQH